MAWPMARPGTAREGTVTREARRRAVLARWPYIVVNSVGPRSVETTAHGYKFPSRIPLHSLTSGIRANFNILEGCLLWTQALKKWVLHKHLKTPAQEETENNDLCVCV
jgi:hypothetical protein